MSIARAKLIGIAAFLALVAGCGASEADSDGSTAKAQPTAQLGLMTGLPLYWPLGAEFGDLASGSQELPWQRAVLESRFELVPLDTLSPIPGLSEEEPDTDPLAGLTRLAVIQPRGLAPADNVALDKWVRGGGRLLLVLDPVLTGEYDLPLGDPRRPIDALVIPPVIDRWGLQLSAAVYEEWEAGVRDVSLRDNTITVIQAGQMNVINPDAASCNLYAGEVIAQCTLGKGRVTVLADAAMFEHDEIAGDKGQAISAILNFAFE